jgi:PAS domain S-box-containing protein
LFERLFEAAPDAILVADADGRIVLANACAAALFGRAAAALRGMALDALLPAARGRAPGEALELEGVRADGATFHAEVSLVEIATAQGPLVSAAIRDVGERKRREAVRQRAEAELEELERLREVERLKNNFINMAAHELRGPLTPLVVQAHLLQTTLGESLTEPQRRAVDILARNVGRLAELTADLLDVASIEARSIGLVRAPADLSSVVQDAALTAADEAAHRRVRLEGRIAAGITADLDSTRMGQALLHLLLHAVRAVPAGSRVDLRAGTEGPDAVVEIAFPGPPLDPRDAGRVFEPFAAPGKDGLPAGSSRLGLYLSKVIVELHGGRVAWAQRGADSVIRCTMPARGRPRAVDPHAGVNL